MIIASVVNAPIVRKEENVNVRKKLKEMIMRSKSEAAKHPVLHSIQVEDCPEARKPLNDRMKRTLLVFKKFMDNSPHKINGRPLPKPITVLPSQ